MRYMEYDYGNKEMWKKLRNYFYWNYPEGLAPPNLPHQAYILFHYNAHTNFPSQKLDLNMISPQPPPSPPFPLLGIAALIFTYVVICYLVIDFVGEVEEDISETPSSKDEESSGLSLQELQKVPCFNCGVGRSLVCAVCLDGIEDGEKCRMFPVCSHVYHAYCIDLWLIRKLSCPTCRAPLNITASLDNV